MSIQKFVFRYRYCVTCTKVAILLALYSSSIYIASAQDGKMRNLNGRENKPFQFGYVIGTAFVSHKLSFVEPSSPLETQLIGKTVNSSFALRAGVLGSLMVLKNYIYLYTEPGFILLNKEQYLFEKGPGEQTETEYFYNYVYLPLFVKFTTKRYNNFRPYFMVGGSILFNVIGAKPEYLIQHKQISPVLEMGIGLENYFSFFRFSPEIKLMIGLNNDLTTPIDIQNTTIHNQISFSRFYAIALTLRVE